LLNTNDDKQLKILDSWGVLDFRYDKQKGSIMDGLRATTLSRKCADRESNPAGQSDPGRGSGQPNLALQARFDCPLSLPGLVFYDAPAGREKWLKTKGNIMVSDTHALPKIMFFGHFQKGIPF